MNSIAGHESYTIISVLDTKDWPEIAVDFFERSCAPILKRLLPDGEKIEIVNIYKQNKIEIRVRE